MSPKWVILRSNLQKLLASGGSTPRPSGYRGLGASITESYCLRGIRLGPLVKISESAPEVNSQIADLKISLSCWWYNNFCLLSQCLVLISNSTKSLFPPRYRFSSDLNSLFFCGVTATKRSFHSPRLFSLPLYLFSKFQSFNNSGIENLL